jgi:hypothetical protein
MIPSSPSLRSASSRTWTADRSPACHAGPQGRGWGVLGAPGAAHTRWWGLQMGAMLGREHEGRSCSTSALRHLAGAVYVSEGTLFRRTYGDVALAALRSVDDCGPPHYSAGWAAKRIQPPGEDATDREGRKHPEGSRWPEPQVEKVGGNVYRPDPRQ